MYINVSNCCLIIFFYFYKIISFFLECTNEMSVIKKQSSQEFCLNFDNNINSININNDPNYSNSNKFHKLKKNNDDSLTSDKTNNKLKNDNLLNKPSDRLKNNIILYQTDDSSNKTLLSNESSNNIIRKQCFNYKNNRLKPLTWSRQTVDYCIKFITLLLVLFVIALVYILVLRPILEEKLSQKNAQNSWQTKILRITTVPKNFDLNTKNNNDDNAFNNKKIINKVNKDIINLTLPIIKNNKNEISSLYNEIVLTNLHNNSRNNEILETSTLSQKLITSTSNEYFSDESYDSTTDISTMLFYKDKSTTVDYDNKNVFDSYTMHLFESSTHAFNIEPLTKVNLSNQFGFHSDLNPDNEIQNILTTKYETNTELIKSNKSIIDDEVTTQSISVLTKINKSITDNELTKNEFKNINNLSNKKTINKIINKNITNYINLFKITEKNPINKKKKNFLIEDQKYNNLSNKFSNINLKNNLLLNKSNNLNNLKLNNLSESTKSTSNLYKQNKLIIKPDTFFNQSPTPMLKAINSELPITVTIATKIFKSPKTTTIKQNINDNQLNRYTSNNVFIDGNVKPIEISIETDNYDELMNPDFYEHIRHLKIQTTIAKPPYIINTVSPIYKKFDPVWRQTPPNFYISNETPPMPPANPTAKDILPFSISASVKTLNKQNFQHNNNYSTF